MSKYLPVAAIVALGLSGVVHGFWTGRWELGEGPSTAANRLESAALELPDWQGEPVEVKGSSNSSAIRHLYRRYVHRATGKEVMMLLVVGKPGPVSVHTPDVCYGASGYQVTAPSKVPVVDGETEFWTARARKKRATEEINMRIFWAWNTKGDWVASSNPRGDFLWSPVLYKLYLARDLAHADEPLQDDPCTELMKQLLPELRKSIFSRS